MTDTTHDTSDPARPAASRSDRPGWWILAAGAAVVILVIGAVGVTAALVDDDDDDDDDFVSRQPTFASEPYDLTDSDDQALLAAAAITPERASTIAVNAVGGGAVTDLDIDSEGGVLVYEIEVHDPTASPIAEKDVVLDAETGDVISVVDDG